MTLRGYKSKTKPATWTTTPAGKLAIAKVQLRVVRHIERTFGKLKLSKICKPVKRIRQVSKSKQAMSNQYRRDAAAFVAAAAARGERCQVVAAVPELMDGKFNDRISECHHQRGRSGSLLLDKRFWLACSRLGHRWIHENINEARALGFLCAKGLWNVPPRPGRCIQCGYKIDPSCELCGECSCETEGND